MTDHQQYQTDGLQYLRDIHKKIIGLLRQLEGQSGRRSEMIVPVLREILAEMEIHFRLEEDVLYPAVEALQDTVLTRKVDDLRGQGADFQRDVSALRSQLSRSSVSEPKDSDRVLNSERIQGRIADLIEDMELHVENQEHGLMKSLEVAQAQAEFLGKLHADMMECRDELMRRPEYQDALPERAQDPHGGEQKRRASGGEAA